MRGTKVVDLDPPIEDEPWVEPSVEASRVREPRDKGKECLDDS